RRGGGEAVTLVDERVHLGGGEDFEDGEERGLTQSVGVPAQEDRAADALVPAEVDDGRGDGRDVRLVEGAVEARAAVPRSAEAHGLGGHRGVGNEIVIGVEKRGDVHEILILGQLASACSHIPTLPNPHRGAQLCPRSSCIVDGAEAQSGGSELVSSSSFVSPPRTSRSSSVADEEAAPSPAAWASDLVHEILILGQLASACSHIPTLPNPHRGAQLCPRSSCIVDGAEAQSGGSELVSSSSFVSPPRTSRSSSVEDEEAAPSPAAWASLGSRSTGTSCSAAMRSSLSSGVCELPSASVSESTLTEEESISFSSS